MQLVSPDSTQAWQLSGFLLQSGKSVTGSFLSVPNASGLGCNGVGSVNGTLNGQNLKLDVNESSQDVSLSGTLSSTAPSSSTPLTGQFSTLAGGCTSSSAAGTWSAVLVTPISGSFHGSFVSAANGTVQVTGALTQGPNTGYSNASLSGTINATGPTRFCSYLTADTLGGFISGTQVTLNIYGSNGSEVGTIPAIDQAPATLTADGKSLTGNYVFQQISNSCLGDSGTFSLTFP